MTLPTNNSFNRLLTHLQAQGEAACLRSETTDEYQRFIQAFPLAQLPQLSLDQYCVGKGDGASFCWWIERGLVPVLGRYMPGTAKGHILYFQPDGSLYKNRRLLDLGDDDALRYTLTIQSTIAAVDPADMLWVDDDKEIYLRAGVEPRVTVAPGRKLRLLSCYHPADTLPISSSEHLAHYLQALGCPEQDIPRSKQPVARMLKLREYYQLACESVPGLSPYGFMRGLYSDEVDIAPVKAEQTDDESDSPGVFVPILLEHGNRVDWDKATHVRLLSRPADTPKAQESLDFIALHASDTDIAAIADLQPEFPGRLRSTKGQQGAMRFDLRHFANSRDSGDNPQDKGLIELGYLEAADSNQELPMSNPNVPLNQIIFGPPGTGKTYATIEAALEVLDGRFLQGHRQDRVALKQRFDQLADEGRIRFVTFHQSFSYEDFVEGLRAESDEASGQLRYEVVDGVFKQMCQLQLAIPVPQENEVSRLTQRVLSFRFGGSGQHEEDIASVIEGGLIELDRQDVKPGDLVLVTDGIQFLRAVGVVTHCGFPEEGRQSGRMEVNVSWLKVFTPPIPLHEVVPKPSPVHQSYFLKPDRISRDALQSFLSEPELMEKSLKTPESKVLIIDEINRGNVSRIFGELITLIEPSKRAGAEEALSVVLPYSKQRFSVPSNVYLIGTMNTADRSLAGLDIALRRRFAFKEMLPDHQLLKDVLVEGIDIGELLEVMNQRIEVLLDRDHCLGHAYFMSLKSGDPLARLESIFRNQILPLLQEYFFEDWQRIQWVLNDHRKPKADRFVEQAKPDLNSLFGSSVMGVQGGIWRVMPDAFKRASAYAGVIAAKTELHIVEADNVAIAESEG